MTTLEDDMKQFEQTAMAVATASAASPPMCTYEVPPAGIMETVAFRIDVGPIGGEPCLSYADCPYDFSWLFVDVHPSGAPKTFSMVAMYRQGIDTLQRVVSGNAGSTLSTTFAYRFAGFYTDNLVLIRNDTTSSHSVDVAYVKTGDGGEVLMRVGCAPVAVASGP
jgi:hypothetical protein